MRSAKTASLRKPLREGRLERTEEGFLLCAERGRDTGDPPDPSHTSEPMLRRDFIVRERRGIKKGATCNVTRQGNLRRVREWSAADGGLVLGASQYDKHIQYQVYDITKRLQPGCQRHGLLSLPRAGGVMRRPTP
ncbi:MAG: hypothetical protein ACLR23_27745 [Clostridia bacterium]